MVIDASSIYVKTLFYRFVFICGYSSINCTQKALYSPWGRKMRAIRDNEEAASAMAKI